MEDTTIISYSRSRSDSLLSLAESRSRYMLPFGGRFRVVDFTIQNAVYSGARKTIIFNDYMDDLESYVNRYNISGDPKFPALKVISREVSDAGLCRNLVMDSNTAYYIIYNGDNPSIIDFAGIHKIFQKSKSKASLFKLKLTGQQNASMAHTILVATQKYLLDVIDTAIKKKQESPNAFEMIINNMINKGIKSESFAAYYWAMRTIPDYYSINMEILKNQHLSSLIYHKSPIKSFITEKGQAVIGATAKIADSIVSDNCRIYGTVLNSIIYPGVEIGENSYIRDSIILPNVIIGSGTNITKAIIDESTDTNAVNNTDKNVNSVNSFNGVKETAPAKFVNIGSRCYVGTSDGQIKNNEFPTLNNSLTLIGKNCRIPDDARVGGACFVASGLGESYFQKNRHLYNGLSVLN